MSPRDWWEAARDAALEWNDDNGPQMGAALAYYTLFSLAPLLIIAISVAGVAFGRQEAREQILAQIRVLTSPETASAIERLLAHARFPERGPVAGAIGFVTLLVGASGVTLALQNAFHSIWRPPADEGLAHVLRRYAVGYALVLGAGALAFLSLVASAALAAVGAWTRRLIPYPPALMKAANVGVTLAGLTCLFAAMFRWLSDARPAWREVWRGALVTALLFAAGKGVLGLYLGRSAFGSMYGAAASLVLVLLWIYYSSQILYLGAEFTKVCDRRARRRA